MIVNYLIFAFRKWTMHHSDLVDNASYVSLDDAVLKYLILNMIKNKISNLRVPSDMKKTKLCQNSQDRLTGLTFVHIAICGFDN